MLRHLEHHLRPAGAAGDGAGAPGALRLPKIFGDGMVLQQGKPVRAGSSRGDRAAGAVFSAGAAWYIFCIPACVVHLSIHMENH